MYSGTTSKISLRCVTKLLGSHKHERQSSPTVETTVSLGAVTPAATTIERLARLVLLVCTVLGVAALHTVGHAAISSAAHHDTAPAVATVSATPATVSATPVMTAPLPAPQDDCDGDGCAHQSPALTGSGQASRWWEACVAVLTAPTLAVLSAGLPLAMRVERLTLLPAAGHRPLAEWRAIGLALTGVAVIRT
jgi:hypothetical protein